MPFTPCRLDDLTIDDERSFRHVGLYEQLKQTLRRDGYRFLVPEGGAEASWSRVLFLNLTFWSPESQSDVLASDHIDADVVAHVAWHHVARKALAGHPPCAGALLLGEAIASAFDLYLVGRLLGHAPESTFLETQVPAMVEAAAEAGAPEEDVSRLFDRIAANPEQAFEDLRALLFDVSMNLVQCTTTAQADAVLERASAHRFAPFLHHYELSTWVLYAKAHAPTPSSCSAAVRAIDDALRAAPDSLAWLEANWVESVAH